jgi:hypothetical protein
VSVLRKFISGLIPSMESLRAGEIRRKRIMIREMLDGCWSSCIELQSRISHKIFKHIMCSKAHTVSVLRKFISEGNVPSMESLRAGEIRRKRIMIREMLDGCWSSCIEPDMGVERTL